MGAVTWLVPVIFVLMVVAAWWGERACAPRMKQGRIPVALWLALVIVAGVLATWGLRLWLEPTAATWIGSGGFAKACGVGLRFVALLPLVAVGLAGLYLQVLPLMGLSARRLLRALAAMRAVTAAEVSTEPSVRRVWLVDWHYCSVNPPPTEHTLEVESDAPPTVDLESLRSRIAELRVDRDLPLVLDVVPPWDDESRRFRDLVGHLLYDRDDPKAVDSADRTPRSRTT